MDGSAATKSLRGSDLRGADLRATDLRGADLREADFRGSDLAGADLSGALMHGADFRDTQLGNGSLGHPGGDPELTFMFDPEISGAIADDDTRWPVGFQIFQTGIIYDGPAVLALEGELVDVPTVFYRWGQSPLEVETSGQGRIWGVSGWAAHIAIGPGKNTSAAGDKLLAANLRLLVGQCARYREEWWTVGGHDQESATLSIGRDGDVVVVPIADIFDENVRQWWWHAPGAERTG